MVMVTIYCDDAHPSRKIRPQDSTFEGHKKVKLICFDCHREVQYQADKWLRIQATLTANKVLSISLQNLDRFAKA